MKKTAILINTSRGPVIKEADLKKALDEGIIAAAGVDVLSTEPAKEDNPLLTCKNCIITPHIAWASFEARSRLMNIFKSNVEAFVAGKPINVVN
jgi:glycerate dehydrogenase